MKAALTTLAVSIFVTGAALLAYDRYVVKPGQVIGIVDIAEVYRSKQPS
jgi:hypothetical protein